MAKEFFKYLLRGFLVGLVLFSLGKLHEIENAYSFGNWVFQFLNLLPGILFGGIYLGVFLGIVAVLIELFKQIKNKL